MIIGITGKMMSGKDTFADGIIEKYPHVKKYSFAKPMKDILINIFGFSESEVYTSGGKETMNPFWDITPRKLLQILGTDMFRNVWRDDVWVKCAELYLEQHRDVIIPDVRFDNEAQMIKRRGGFIVRIICDTKIQDEHLSEKGISFGLCDDTIYNDDTIEELKIKAKEKWKVYCEILSGREKELDTGFKRQSSCC
jgi:hypothetical protein